MSDKEEILEIVDENDQPLGYTKSRAAVHKDNLEWHRTSCIWVVNNKKEILCQKINPLKEPSFKDKWVSNFGGHLHVGQDYLISAIAELEEEIGLKVTPNELHFIENRPSEKYKHHLCTYVLWWNGDLDDLVFNDGEVAEAKWFTIEKLFKMKEAGDLKNSIREKVIEFIRNN